MTVMIFGRRLDFESVGAEAGDFEEQCGPLHHLPLWTVLGCDRYRAVHCKHRDGAYELVLKLEIGFMLGEQPCELSANTGLFGDHSESV